MSSQLQDSISRLRTKQHALLKELYDFKSIEDEDTKVAIITQVSNFQEELDYTKSDIQFTYGINLDSKLRINDPTCLDIVAQWHKYNAFLASFKEDLIQKYAHLKKIQLNNFEQQKQDQYGLVVEEDLNADVPLESTAAKEQNVSTDAKILSTTKKITSRLAQSSQILQASLVQSELNFEDLTIQSDLLVDLADKYGYLKNVLEKSDVFIKDIKLSSQKDKTWMYYALIFFGVCLFKVFWSRIFKLPVLFVFKIFWFTIHSLLAGIGLVSRNGDTLAVVDYASSMSSEFTVSASDVTSSVDALSSSLKQAEATVYAQSGKESSDFIDTDVEEGTIENFISEGKKEEPVGDLTEEAIDLALNRIIDEL